jgi:hypothetical protein
LEKVISFRITYELSFGVDADTDIGITDVVVNGVDREVELFCDFLLIEAFVPELHDTQLGIAHLVGELGTAHHVFQSALSS